MHSHNRFDELRAAVKANRKNHIAILIAKDNPEDGLFAGADENNNNVLHLAAKYCIEDDAATIVMLIAYLNQIQCLSIACATNMSGQTPLHLVVRYNSLMATSKIIEAMGDQINVIARMCDNEGRLPLPSLFKAHGKNIIKMSNIKTLLDATYSNPFELSLNDKIDSKKIISRYPKSSPKLIATFEFACDVVNQVRDVMTASSTHPDINNASLSKQIEINELVTKMVRFNVYPLGNIRYIADIKEHKAGNCSEFAVLGLDIIRRNPKVSAELYGLEGKHRSDHTHVFLVLNRLPDSDPNNYFTWGDETVVLDSWAGDVYLALDIPTRMTCHYSLSTTYRDNFRKHNIIELYNSFFHDIGPFHQDYNVSVAPAPAEVGLLSKSLGSFITNVVGSVTIEQHFGVDDDNWQIKPASHPQPAQY